MADTTQTRTETPTGRKLRDITNLIRRRGGHVKPRNGDTTKTPMQKTRQSLIDETIEGYAQNAETVRVHIDGDGIQSHTNGDTAPSTNGDTTPISVNGKANPWAVRISGKEKVLIVDSGDYSMSLSHILHSDGLKKPVTIQQKSLFPEMIVEVAKGRMSAEGLIAEVAEKPYDAVVIFNPGIEDHQQVAEILRTKQLLGNIPVAVIDAKPIEDPRFGPLHAAGIKVIPSGEELKTNGVNMVLDLINPARSRSI